MKKILASIILMSIVSFASLNAQNKLTIVVTGIDQAEGTLYTALFNSPESFLKDYSKGDKTAIDKNEMRIEFSDLPSGSYAVAIYQDENNNATLDRGAFGIPSEKYGFSNNAEPVMGPPRYRAAKFEIDGDTTIYIELQRANLGF